MNIIIKLIVCLAVFSLYSCGLKQKEYFPINSPITQYKIGFDGDSSYQVIDKFSDSTFTKFELDTILNMVVEVYSIDTLTGEEKVCFDCYTQKYFLKFGKVDSLLTNSQMDSLEELSIGPNNIQP